MFDLRSHTYKEVNNFLNKNINKRIMEPCVPIKYDSKNKDLYELFIVGIDYDYFDRKNFISNKVLYEKSEYNDESFGNELSVIDCGGYFMTVCFIQK